MSAVASDNQEPAYWRLLLTDTETLSGVAPVCSQPDVHAMMHGGSSDDGESHDECRATGIGRLVQAEGVRRQ